MVLAAGGEVESAQELLMEACLAQEKIIRWRAALKLHVQVLECQNAKILSPPPQSGQIGCSGAVAARAVGLEEGRELESALTLRVVQIQLSQYP